MGNFNARDYLRKKYKSNGNVKSDKEEETKTGKNDSNEKFDARNYLAKKKSASNVGFDTFSDDLNTTNTTLNSIRGGWQDSETMTNARESITKMFDRLTAYEDYRKTYGTDDDKLPDLSELLGVYKGTLDEWDSIAEVYGGYKSADEYTKAVKAWEEAEAKRKKQEEEWASADLDVRNAQVYALEYHLGEARKLETKYNNLSGQQSTYDYAKNFGFDTTSHSNKVLAAKGDLDRYLGKIGYNSIDELVQSINDKKDFVKQATFYQNGIEMASVSNPEAKNYDKDFASKSKYDPSKIKNSGKWSGIYDIYEYINSDEDGKLDILSLADDSASASVKFYDNMDSSQISLFNYWLGVSEEKAQEYLDSISLDLESKWSSDRLEKSKKFATDHPVLSSIYSVGSNVIGAPVEYIKDQAFYDKTGMMSRNVNAQEGATIRGTVSENTDIMLGNWDAFDFVYNTSMSGVDSLAAVALYGKAGGVALGLSAAASATNDALDRGLSNKQAAWQGYMSGAFEMLFESISIGKFLNEDASKGYLKNLATSMFVNASEETATELANIAYDTFANGDLSNYQVRLQELIDSGKTPEEARRIVAKELTAQVFEAGASGAVMGGGFTTVNTVSYNANASNLGKTIRNNDNVGNVVDLASVQLSPEEKSAYDAYTKYANKGVNAENIKNRQVGNLAYSLRADAEAVLESKDSTPEQRAKAEKTLADLSAYTQKTKVSDFSSDVKKEYKSKESVDALIESGLEGDESSESYKLASEYKEKVGKGKKLSEAEITKLSDLITKEEMTSTANEAKERLTELGEIENIDKIADAISKRAMGFKLTSEENALIENSEYGSEVAREFISDTVLAEGEFAKISSDSIRSEALTEEMRLGARSGENNANAELMEYAEGIDEADRQLFIDTYDGKMPLDEYAKAFTLVNDFVKENAEGKDTQNVILENNAGLSPAQVGNIYKAAVVAPRLVQQKAIDKLVDARKGKLTYKANIDDSVIDYDNKGTAGKVNWNSLTSKQRNAITFVKGFAKGMGINLKFVTDGAKNHYNGKYVKEENTIYIDVHAGVENFGGILTSDTIIGTTSHEVTHWAKNKAPALYAELSNKIFSALSAKKGLTEFELVEAERNRLKKKYGKEFSAEYARDEIIARACEDMLSMSEEGKKMFSSLSEAEQKSLVAKIKEVVKDILKWIDDLLGLYKSDSKEATLLRDMQDELQDIVKAWDEMLVSARNANAALEAEGINAKELITGLAEAHDVQLNERLIEKHFDLLDKNYSEESVLSLDEIKNRYNKVIDLWKSLGGEINSEFLKDWNEKLGTDRVFEVFKAQSGYKYNVELSSMCKKGIPLFEAIDRIVKSEAMKQLTNKTLGKAEKEVLYDILKSEGFDIPCAICYVEQARQREGVIIDAFLDGKVDKSKTGKVTKVKLGWNEVLSKVQTRMKEEYGVDYKFPKLDRSVATDKYTPADINMDIETQEAFYNALKDIANEEITRYNEAEKKNKKLITEVTPSAIKEAFKGNISANFKIFRDLFNDPTSRFMVDNDLLYSSMTTQNIAKYHNTFYTLFNSQYGVNGYKSKQGAVIYWADILNKKWIPSDLRKEGGIRNQSNSDFMMYTFLDHAQMYIDFTAKGYYLQAYTKVLAELKLFGLSNGKINASTIPKVVVYENEDGTVDEEKTKLYAGLDENGNLAFDDIEGINHKEAFMLAEDSEYSKSIGLVCIGYSDNHILKLLDDRRIQQIIGFHDKTNDGKKRYRGARYATNYNGYNEATKKGTDIESEVDTDSDSGKKTKHINYNGFIRKAENKFNGKTEGTVEFNGKVYGWNDVPKLAADMYIAECEKKGLDPAYSKCGIDFSKHPNYYKLLADFSLYDANGNYCPHSKVEFNLPSQVPYLDANGNKAYMDTKAYIKQELKGELKVRDDISAKLGDTSENGIISKWVNKCNEMYEEKVLVPGEGVQLAEREIIGASGKNYGMGVYLDSDDLAKFSEDERKTELKNIVVNKLAGKHFIAYDNNSNAVDIRLATKDEKFKNQKGDKKKVLQELYRKNNKFTVKQEAVVLVDELVANAKYETSKGAKYPHDWLDNYGQNDWDYWKVYIQEKNKTVWEATLNIATSANGEKILYDIDPIEMVEEGIKSPSTTTKDSIHDSSEKSNEEIVNNEGEQLSERRHAPTAHEVMGELKTLENRYKKLEADYGRLKEKLKIEKSLTKGKLIVPSQIDAVARYLLKFGDSNYSKDELVKMLNDLYVDLQDGATNDSMAWDEMYSKAYEVAKEIRSEAKVRIERPAYYDMILKDIRSARIAPNEVQKGDAKHRFGDHYVGKFRGRVTIANDGTPLDEKWSEWASKYPSVFDKDIGDTQQLVELYDIYDDLRNAGEVVQEYEESEVLHSLATEIVNKAWLVTKYESTADKYDKRIKELNFEHRKAMDELRDTYKKKESDAKLLEQMYYGKKLLEKDKKIADQRLADDMYYGKLLNDLRIKRQVEVDRAKALGREKLTQYKENAEKKSVVQRITANSLKLNKMLIDNSKDSHIPEAMKGAVKELLEAIDASSKKWLETGEPTKRDISLNKAFSRLKDVVTDGSEELGDILEDIYGSGLEDTLKEFVKEINNGAVFFLNEMSIEDLKKLDKIVKIVKTAVNKVNMYHSVLSGLSARTHAADTIKDLGKRTKIYNDDKHHFDQLKTKTYWNNLNPYYAFKNLGGSAGEIFTAFQNAQDKLAFLAKEVIDFADGLYTGKEYKKWSETYFEFAIPQPSGKIAKFSMNVPQIMSLYCVIKQEDAKKHILHGDENGEGGGITIAETKDKRAVRQNIRITEADLKNIISKLDDKSVIKAKGGSATAVADKLQEYMGTRGAELGNEITMARWGIKSFGIENYFPIKVSEGAVPQKGDAPGDVSMSMLQLLNASFTHSRNHMSKKSVEIGDVFDVFSNHMSNMVRYNAFALPILDMYKWINYKNVTEAGEEISVQNAVKEAFGDHAWGYLQTFLKDVSGASKSDTRDNIAVKFFKNAKVAKVAGNIRVALLQFTSFIRAGAVMDNKYLLHALHHKPKIQRSEDECGIVLWKSLGYYDTDITRGLTDKIKHDTNAVGWLVDKSLKGAEWADKVTMGVLWNACELEIRDTRTDLKVGSPEFNEAVALRLRDVIYKTQVVDSMLTRSQMMRSPSGWDKMLTTFASESTLSLNLMTDIFVSTQLEARETNRKNAMQKNGKYIRKAITAYVVTNIVTSVLQSVFDAFRDYDEDDKDEEYWAKLMLENFAVNSSMFAKIPYINLFVSALQGFTASRADTDWMNSTIKAGKEIYKLMSGSGDPEKLLRYMLKAGSDVTGVAAYNVYRDVVAFYMFLTGNGD